MNEELEVITIDEKDYIVLKEISKNNRTFLYLSNIEDEDDTLIRKLDNNNKDLVVPLESEKEFELACNLLLKNFVN